MSIVETQISAYIASQSEQHRTDLQAIHDMIRAMKPEHKLWFLDGRNSDGKVVANPNIGYGSYTINYADGKSREFYQIGVSANTTGISVYIMGLSDKSFLSDNYGKTIGKAKVTGYCIKFKALKDIHIHILEQAIRDRFEAPVES